jgi:hypothetical protein
MTQNTQVKNYTAEKKDWETVINEHVATFGEKPFNVHTNSTHFSEYLTLQESCFGVRTIIQTIQNYAFKNGEDYACIIKDATGQIESISISLYGDSSSVYNILYRLNMYELYYDHQGNFISGTDAYGYEINSLDDLEGFDGEQLKHITEEEILNFKLPITNHVINL